MARLKEELENRMERISGTLLIGTQMFSQLQQRQCIAEATAKEQQCLVDYFAQLRPKRWQEWEHKYSGLSTAQYIFLIMQDDLHFDDESIATILDVKRVSVVFPSTLEVVFIRLNVDSEQAGTVWSEFVANIIEGIDGSEVAVGYLSHRSRHTQVPVPATTHRPTAATARPFA